MSTKHTWNGLFDELRERREARAQRRELERDLSAYTSPHDIHDLLAAVERDEGPDAELVRAVLGAHLVQAHRRIAMSA